MMKFDANSRLTRRRFTMGVSAVAAGVAATCLLRTRAALAAVSRNAPVRFVVANTPGGPSDITGRIVTAALEQSTGKTFIVENRGGAGGNIGMGYVANADPDGYTILLATNAYSVNFALYNKLPSPIPTRTSSGCANSRPHRTPSWSAPKRRRRP